MVPSNKEFLQAVFRDDAPFVHVTDFMHDPSNIPSDKHLTAWKGDWSSRYNITPNSNQYFTISIFNPDDQGVARRRKALFLRTRVIVLDDVKEKLSMDAVGRLPEPSWILETSRGSEQWGYILTEPCGDRGRVENLLDGLVANGLAPDGKDPGMKGVTRYVRLPDGYNTKASKLVDGEPFKCLMTEWHPERTCTMEALAAPFHVNLDAVRREARTDGAADIPDHPLLQIPDIINIKEIRSNGRFDITCPWVDEHTGGADDGTAIFTNEDGSTGFKCHHGGCEGRTARDLTRYIELQSPGFGEVFSNWRMKRVFADIIVDTPVNIPAPPSASVDPTITGFESIIDMLRLERPTSPEARKFASEILKLLEETPAIERKHWHDEVCDLMHWTKQDFKAILKDLRAEWYGEKVNASFLSNIVFIKEQNRFYNYNTQIFFTPDAFQNSYSDQDAEIRKTALQEGAVTKVDKIDFAPRQPRVFQRGDIWYGNTWCASKMPTGVQGDCSNWLNHWDELGWGEYRDHHLQWMAYTLKHPEDKINHIIILGGMEGTGKDFLLYPLIKAMGEYTTTIEGNELLGNHNEYLTSTKHLHINETELGDHRQSREVSNKLKPLAAAPPHKLRVNPKGITAIDITNIVNCSMSTNDHVPVRLNGPSRRFHGAWSHLNVRDSNDEMLPKWIEYWNDRWTWMKDAGHQSCIFHLLNDVDISKFNPGAAPPMTDFLRNIREASKSPGQHTLETFIHSRLGSFKSDLITSSEMSASIRVIGGMSPEMLQTDSQWFTATRINRIMGDIGGCAQLTGADGDVSVRMWAVRNTDSYCQMTKSELLRQYQEQISQCKAASSSMLQVMK